MIQGTRFWRRTVAIWVLLLVVGPVMASQAQQARAKDFVGTWYGVVVDGSDERPFKLELKKDGQDLAGSVWVLLGSGQRAAFDVNSVEIRDNALYLEIEGSEELPVRLNVELHVPKDELIGRIGVPEDGESFLLTVAKDAPDLAARFAGAKEVAPTERQGASQRARCATNLKQLGVVMKMYAYESRGKVFPLLDPRPGRLMFRMEDIYPEYLVDLNILLCPADEEAIAAKPDQRENPSWYFNDTDYWYLGYAIQDEKAGLAFVEAYRKQAVSGEGFDVDLDIDQGRMTIYRLREGIERFFITDINNPAASPNAQSKLPIIIEPPGRHDPDGGNVLFMDGHVEFITYPGPFPMTERFIQALASLDDLEKAR